MLNGMEKETARRYIKVLEKIEDIVDKIHAVAYLMSLLCELEEGQADIRPFTIGCLGKMIAQDVLLITSLLENDFASTTDIMIRLEEKE